MINPGTVLSTNTYAMELLNSEDLPEGTVIQADFQSMGKGQRGSIWESAPLENLTFSLVLKPGFLNAAQQFRISECISLGIYDYVSQELKKHDNITPVMIKWPNDILVGGDKISGILIENSLQGASIRHSVAGIGLNINQDHSGSEFRATSLKMLTKNGFNRNVCLQKLLSSLEKWYLIMRSGGHSNIHKEYLKRLLGYERITTFLHGNIKFSGEITGVNESGKLCVLVEGKNKEFEVKEVSYPA